MYTCSMESTIYYFPKSFEYYSVFKRLGSRHIHKEINLQKGMNGIDKIQF